MKRCKKRLKQYYLNRMDQSQSTKWPQLGDPEFYLDVTITRAKYSYQMKEKDVSLRMERYCEDYAMGLVDNKDDITIEKLLLNEKGKVTLIEGDPGSGKTTLTIQICKRWAKDKLLTEQFLIWVPLRCYELATNANDLFELFEKLGCPVPGMKEYAEQNDGEGLVLILDGWDELPNQLQSQSLFSDIVYSKSSIFYLSTIIVTSRPSCSENIAKVVEQRKGHYQILGFSPHNSELFIKHYFNNDLQSAELLITILKGREYLRRHFYIPITVTIMCYVYSHSDGDIPETLSKLYEDFVLLYIRSNTPDTCRKDIEEFHTLSDVPKILQPIFSKLCKIAYDMSRNNKLVFNEDMLTITDNDLKALDLASEQFDGLGLLHVEHSLTKRATAKKSYNFIHRSVQELLAAIFILGTSNLSGILDEYFYDGSYFMNVFPFLFGLASKELLRPLARKLIQIFNKDDRLLSSILYCLFEAQEEFLCREFGEVFSEKIDITLHLRTLLDYYYGCYFIIACGIKRLNVNIINRVSGSCDPCVNVFCKCLQSASTDIASFHFLASNSLSHEGIEQFAKSLSTQNNILSMRLYVYCAPGCVTIFCNSICKHNPQITDLWLPLGNLNKNDLKSVTMILTTLSLNSLCMFCSPSGGMCLNLSLSVCKTLCETKSLQKLLLCRWSLSQAESEVFGNGISQNYSLKELQLTVEVPDCLCPILNGLSSNASITTFRVYVSEIGVSNALGQCLEKCLTLNHSLNILDFTERNILIKYIWSSTEVSCICTGLCANTTVVTLDISGCHIDTEACHAVCSMLSQNTTLKHFFLNPVHLEKQEAVAIIDSCRANATLELLSLVHWPPNIYVYDSKPFRYSCDPEIKTMLLKILKLREDQENSKPVLNVYWLVATYIVLMCCYPYCCLCIGNIMSIEKLRTRFSIILITYYSRYN